MYMYDILVYIRFEWIDILTEGVTNGGCVAVIFVQY